MALKAIVENLDAVDESIRDAYKETETSSGKVFVLDVDGITSHPLVLNLKNAHERVKTDKHELSRELGELKSRVSALPEDFDPDEWDRMRSEDDARRSDPDNKDVRSQIDAAVSAAKSGFDKILQRAKKEAEAAVAERERKIAELEGELNAGLVGGGLRQALINVGVKKGLIDAAVAKFERDTEVVVEDGRRQARMKPELGGSDFASYFQNWASSDEARDFIDPARGDDESGSRNTRGTGENPFARAAWNKTAQAALLRADRGKAERLAKAAGFRSLAAALGASRPPE